MLIKKAESNNKLYLVNAGVINEQIGITQLTPQSYGWSRADGDGYIALLNKSDGKYGGFRSTNKVDFSPYSKMYIKYKTTPPSETTPDPTKSFWGVFDGTNYLASKSMQTSENNIITELDISQCNIDAYFRIYMYVVNYGGQRSLYIYDWWVE